MRRIGDVQTRHRERGVLEDGEIREIGGPVETGVLTFDSVFHFTNPVPYATLRQAGVVGGLNLVTAQPITLEQAEEVIRLGQPRV